MAGSGSSSTAMQSDPWPNPYHLDLNAMRSYSATRIAEIARDAGATFKCWKKVQDERPGYVVSLADFFAERGWLETQMGFATVEGIEPPEEEYIPGPIMSVTDFAVPATPNEPESRTYVSDQGIQTTDLEEAHAKRFLTAIKVNLGPPTVATVMLFQHVLSLWVLTWTLKAQAWCVTCKLTVRTRSCKSVT